MKNNDIRSHDDLDTLLRHVDAMVEFESNDHHRGSGSLVRRVCMFPFSAWRLPGTISSATCSSRSAALVVDRNDEYLAREQSLNLTTIGRQGDLFQQQPIDCRRRDTSHLPVRSRQIRHLLIVVAIRFESCLDWASQVPWVVEVFRQLSRPSIGLLDAIVLSLMLLSRHTNLRRCGFCVLLRIPFEQGSRFRIGREGSDTFLVRGARRVGRIKLVEAGEGGSTPEKAHR